jgi:hypothetical protein
LDVENRPVNGYGYLEDEVPDHRTPAGLDQTIPVDLMPGPAPDSGPGPGADSAPGRELKQGLVADAPAAHDLPQFARSAQGPGKWLRGLIGVDESLLDRVWEERARYTCLGAIVLGTATMAALSMLDAMDQIFGPVWPVLVLVALFWGAFICGVDRWLIASTHGTHSGRWRIFIPRIILALLFGMIIATPLVLTVFGSEVVSQAQDDQRNAVLMYESQLEQCNPLPNASQAAQAAAQSASCIHFHVQVNDSAIGTDKAIASEQAQRNGLNNIISSDNTQISNLNTIARDECNGVPGKGLSGFVGVGPNCIRDRQKADNFASTSDVGELQSRVTDLDNEIAAQTATAGQQTQTYATNISNAITKLVAEKSADEGRIGLLNRIDALGELASRQFVIAVATVMLAIFIIAVDCLPVLSKMMSGTTRYDEILEFRLRAAAKMAAEATKVSEWRATSRDEIALHRLESELQAQRDQIDDASRVDRAMRGAELDRRIAQLAAQYRRLAD